MMTGVAIVLQRVVCLGYVFLNKGSEVKEKILLKDKNKQQLEGQGLSLMTCFLTCY